MIENEGVQEQGYEDPVENPAPENGASTETVVSGSTVVDEPEYEADVAQVDDDEIYAGEFNPNPTVTETLKIIEDGEFPSYGAVLLSNLDSDELMELQRRFLRMIANSQKSRREYVSTHDNHDLLAASTEAGDLYLTESEAEALAVIQRYTASIRNGPASDICKEPDDWTNLVTHNNQPISLGRVKTDTSKDPILRIRGRLGLSVPTSVPLWNSGINLTLNGPGILEQLHLEHSILASKIDSARDTTGIALASTSVYTYGPILDFIMNNVTESNIGTTDRDVLLDTILLPDLDALIAAQASTVFPDGYNLERPCLTDRGGCGHVVRRKVSPRRMVFVRRKHLTESQLAFMSRVRARNDILSVRNYQESIRPEVSRLIDLGNGTALRMRVPSLSEYLRISKTWVERMDRRAKDIAGGDATQEEREIFLERANRISTVLLFVHWFDAFMERDDPDDPTSEWKVAIARAERGQAQLEEIASKDNALSNILEDLSGDSTMLEKIVNGVRQFISDITLTTVCIPKTICPACKRPATGDETSDHPHLVPVNPVELFFTLLHHRILIAKG